MQTILILEDNPAVMGFFCVLLSAYKILEATSIEEAFQQFVEHHRTLSLMIADIILPAGSGIDAALFVRGAMPELPIILTSGYPESMWSESDLRHRNRLSSVRILQKPFLPATLLTMVSDLLQKPVYLARVAGVS